jgi:hypothetical protein
MLSRHLYQTTPTHMSFAFAITIASQVHSLLYRGDVHPRSFASETRLLLTGFRNSMCMLELRITFDRLNSRTSVPSPQLTFCQHGPPVAPSNMQESDAVEQTAAHNAWFHLTLVCADVSPDSP